MTTIMCDYVLFMLLGVVNEMTTMVITWTIILMSMSIHTAFDVLVDTDNDNDNSHNSNGNDNNDNDNNDNDNTNDNNDNDTSHNNKRQ